MKNIYKKLLNILLVFIFFSLNNAFAINSPGSQDEVKTIGELKDNIQVLKSEKVINFSIFEKFKNKYGELQNYFSKDLTTEQFLEIELIFSNYDNKKKIIESQNNDGVIQLVVLEKELYNSLLVYIDINKLELYNIFVEKSISTLEKGDEIEEKIENKEGIIEEKVSTIKNKIEENNKIQEEKLNTILETSIRERILKFKNTPKIELLPEEKQKILFKIVLDNIKKKRTKIKIITNKQKIIFNIIEKVLLELIEEK